MTTERYWVDPGTGIRYRARSRPDASWYSMSEVGGWCVAICDEGGLSTGAAPVPLAALRWFLSVVEGSGNDDQ